MHPCSNYIPQTNMLLFCFLCLHSDRHCHRSAHCPMIGHCDSPILPSMAYCRPQPAAWAPITHRPALRCRRRRRRAANRAWAHSMKWPKSKRKPRFDRRISILGANSTIANRFNQNSGQRITYTTTMYPSIGMPDILVSDEAVIIAKFNND